MSQDHDIVFKYRNSCEYRDSHFTELYRFSECKFIGKTTFLCSCTFLRCDFRRSFIHFDDIFHSTMDNECLFDGAVMQGERIGGQVVLYDFRTFRKLYDYDCAVAVTRNAEKYIFMGCKTFQNEPRHEVVRSNRLEYPLRAPQSKIRMHAFDFLTGVADVMIENLKASLAETSKQLTGS